MELNRLEMAIILLVPGSDMFIMYMQTGNFETLFDSRHEQKKNTADIGYDPVKKIVYVPTFMGKTVAAYQLQ